MIRNLLASTAIATLIAAGAYAPAFAQTVEPMPGEQTMAPNVIHSEDNLASRIIGQRVYNSAGEDAENIGSVKDIVISANGEVEAIVIGVGGFLGIGQKDVALEYDLAEWVERDGDRWLVVSTNREALEALPEFDTAAYRPLPADTQVGNTTPATAEDLGIAAAPAATDAAPVDDMAAAPADDTGAVPGDTAATTGDMSTEPAGNMAAAPADDITAPADDMAAAPADDVMTDDTQTSAIDRSALSDVTGQVSADELIGTTVYGANDENVGSINDVILSDDGTVEAVIIDVGGFLGIGAKPVAVSMDNLAFLRDGDGSTYLYTQFTRDQLEAHPEYDASSFAQNRDGQLLVVPAQ